MNILTVEQRTPEWVVARRGKVTASRIKDVIATLKRGQGEPAARANYKADIIVEILTGCAVDHYVSSDMQRGIDEEPLARAAYEFKTGNEVNLIGFVQHESIERSGASPDGTIGDDGLLEIKCPRTATHLEYMLAGIPPEEYVPQMQWQMACTGAKWCDFVSFDSRLPEYLQLFIVRCERDGAMIRNMEAAVRSFLREIDELIERLPKPEAAEVRG